MPGLKLVELLIGEGVGSRSAPQEHDRERVELGIHALIVARLDPGVWEPGPDTSWGRRDAGVMLDYRTYVRYSEQALPGPEIEVPLQDPDTSDVVHAASCDDRELGSQLADRAEALAAQQRDLLRFVREFDARRLWQRDGCRDMGQWLAGHFGISASAGRRWTHAAHALEHLPVVSDALARGSISLDKVLELARFATKETERELLSYARRASLNALRRKADVANRPDVDDHVSDHHGRFLEWRRINDSGAIYIEALFPAAEGAIVIRELRRIADTLPEMPPTESRLEATELPEWAGLGESLPAETVEIRDGLPQRLADALVVMAMGAGSAGGPATVVVSAPLAALTGDEQGCEIAGCGIVHPEIARRLACDPRLQWVVRDGDDIAKGIGTTSRVVNPSLRRELEHRDGGCTFPGCGSMRYVDAHHLRHWIFGGKTQLDNLTLVCHFHHKLLHEHRWMVHLDERNRARWLRPDGTPYEPGLL